jgi:hypothetical protein
MLESVDPSIYLANSDSSREASEISQLVAKMGAKSDMADSLVPLFNLWYVKNKRRYFFRLTSANIYQGRRES